MARLFEGYLYDGKTFSPQLKTIFAKIAQWMRRIYRGMETHGVTLTDDIVRAYDDLLTRKDSGVARAEGEGVMAQTADKENLIRKYTDKTRYHQDEQEEHLYIHPERMTHAEINNTEKEKLRHEMAMARKLARHYGFDVFLLPEDFGSRLLLFGNKSPDGIVNGIFFDEKQAVTGTERSIQGNFRKARKQAEMLYLDLSQTNVGIEKAVAYINGQITADEDVSESFHVVIENKDGIFSEFRVDINKKELVKSTFLSSPRSNPWSDSNIASNSDSVKPDVLAQAAEANAAPGRADVDKVLAQTVTIEGYGETAKKQSLEFLDKNAGKEFRTLTGEIIRLPSSRRQRRHIWFTSQKNPQKSDLRRNYNYILNLENLIENAKFQNRKKK